MKKQSLPLLLLMIILMLCSSCCLVHIFAPESQDVGALEEYLIDFSKKITGYQMTGGTLPADLDADKYFSILGPLYGNDEMIKEVRMYPVLVTRDDESYVLILCDKESLYIYYKDLGKTIDKVDYPYWRQQKKIACPEK